MPKIVLITGTSSGVGLCLTRLLASKSHKVYATVRNLETCHQLKELAEQMQNITIKHLDIQDWQSIETCVEEIISQEGRIDVLVNNAGAGMAKNTEQATLEELNWAMDVNFMGTVRCTKAVLPHMRVARSGHVINLSSIGGLVGQPFNEIYCAAKFAIEGYTEALASYVQPAFNVKFTAIEPGGIQSEFFTKAAERGQKVSANSNDDYAKLFAQYVERKAERSGSVFQTPEGVAEAITKCIENDNPPVRMRTSEWAEQFCHLKTDSDPDGKKLQKEISESFL